MSDNLLPRNMVFKGNVLAYPSRETVELSVAIGDAEPVYVKGESDVRLVYEYEYFEW